MSEQVDICIVGATGFTGRLICEFIAESKELFSDVKFGIAGRNRQALEAVRKEMTAVRAECANMPIFVCSSDDRASLDVVTRSAKVVLSTVGPYAIHGHMLVERCVENGCSYVDITGEVQFVRSSIERHHDAAVKKRVAIVHCCGFDSVPSDIGALVLVEHMRKSRAPSVGRVHHYIGESNGGVSGGTIASAVNLLENTSSGETRASMAPDALTPAGARRTTVRDLFWPKFDALLGKWTTMWMMEGVNTRVVRRSAAFVDYGATFEFSEVMAAPNVFVAYLVPLVTILFVLMVKFPPTNWLLKRFVLPKSGEGPSVAVQRAGFFRSKMIGTSSDGTRCVLHIDGKGDPGYRATSRMVTMAAVLLLRRDETRIGRDGGGVLTPASALGLAFVPYLEKVDIRFKIQ